MVTLAGIEDSIQVICSMLTVGVAVEVLAMATIELISNAAVRLDATDAETEITEVVAKVAGENGGGRDGGGLGGGIEGGGGDGGGGNSGGNKGGEGGGGYDGGLGGDGPLAMETVHSVYSDEHAWLLRAPIAVSRAAFGGICTAIDCVTTGATVV